MSNYIYSLSKLVFVLSAALISTIEPQATVEDSSNHVLHLKIWTDKPIYVAGEDIQVRVQITNISDKDVLIGNDLIWGIKSPSHVQFEVTPKDGHPLSYQSSVADGFTPRTSDDFAGDLLDWCLKLSPGYSYSGAAQLQQFVTGGLSPGGYLIRARYISTGIDADEYFNPLLGRAGALAKLKRSNWSGELISNEGTFRIVSALSPSVRGSRLK